MGKEIRQEGDYTITDGIHGDTYHHPSFGMLSFSRTHGGHSNLFGSSIQHRDTIHMVLKEGTVARDLNEDWYFGGPGIVEVEMSQSQFAELITSMNMGSGVPCTIKFIKGKGRIPEPDFINKREQITNEFKERMDDKKASANKIYEEIKTLFDTKKSIGKGDRAAILRKIHSITNGLSSEANFMFRQFQEQMDKTITQAKGEIEAFAQNRINTIAQQAIAEQKDAILKLENPVDISHMELDSAEGQNMEKLLAEVEKLNDNTPDGCIRDADTILVDLIEENDFEFFGFAHDIFNIWKNSSDKEAVEQMFYEFTDMSFKEYLEKCKREISR